MMFTALCRRKGFLLAVLYIVLPFVLLPGPFVQAGQRSVDVKGFCLLSIISFCRLCYFLGILFKPTLSLHPPSDRTRCTMVKHTERETERETETQTDRDRESEIDRQTLGQTDRQTETGRDREMQRQRETDRDIETETERQRHTERCT